MPDKIIPDSKRDYTLKEAGAFCAGLAKTHYENFSVVSWFLPKSLRQHFYNIYAFCRWSDDLADESESAEIALKNLARWEEELRGCYGGKTVHPVFIALKETIKKFDLPMEPFSDLIAAFRMDQEKNRYETFEELLSYCRGSANPVGRLILYLGGYRDEERHKLSDCTCTALQLANFWQDVWRDYLIGRIYIPREDLRRFGYSEGDLAKKTFNGNFRELISFETERTRKMFEEGAKLPALLDGKIRKDVELFGRGGLKILDRIEQQGYDVLCRRPALTKTDKTVLMLGRIFS